MPDYQVFRSGQKRQLINRGGLVTLVKSAEAHESIFKFFRKPVGGKLDEIHAEKRVLLVTDSSGLTLGNTHLYSPRTNGRAFMESQFRKVLSLASTYPNLVVMAYDLSATYNLKEELEVAPAQIGQFTTFGEFTEEHLQTLFDEIEKDLTNCPLLDRLAKRYYLQGIRNRLFGGEGTPNPKCVALNSHLRLLPDGRVPTCQFNTTSVGNLRDEDFADLWANDRIRKQREWVGKCPGCWAECEVLPSAISTGDLLRACWNGR